MKMGKPKFGQPGNARAKNVPRDYICNRASGLSARLQSQQSTGSEIVPQTVSSLELVQKLGIIFSDLLQLLLTIVFRIFAAIAAIRTLSKTEWSSRDAAKLLLGLAATLNTSLSLENAGTVTRNKLRAKQPPLQNPRFLMTEIIVSKASHHFSRNLSLTIQQTMLGASQQQQLLKLTVPIAADPPMEVPTPLASPICKGPNDLNSSTPFSSD